MSTLDVVRLIAGREISERLRSKPFLLSLAFTLVMVLAFAVLPAFLSDDGPTSYDLAVDDSALVARLQAVADAEGGDLELDVRTVEDRRTGEALVTDSQVDAAILDGEVIVDEDLGDRLAYVVQTALLETSLPDPAPVRALDPPDEDEDARDSLLFVATILLYGQLIGFGYWVASGVVEEKSSRVVELLLTRARPGAILTGKIVGIGVLGFLQLAGTMVIGVTAAVLAGSIELPPGTAGVGVQVLTWFVLGYALYSCLFAVGGALASRTEELQSTTGPLSLVAMAALLAALAAGSDPSGFVARIATFLPPTAPLVVPIRVANSEIAAWEVVVAVLLILAAIVTAVRLASLAYTGAALHVRGQIKLRDALAVARR